MDRNRPDRPMNGARGIRKALLGLPKADLHCHLDGSLRVRTVLELARSIRHRLPADTEAGLKRHVQVAPTVRASVLPPILSDVTLAHYLVSF